MRYTRAGHITQFQQILTSMKLISRTLACAHLLTLALAGSWPAQAGTITKADNAIDLTNALSWVEAVPGLTDIALWDASVTAANSSTMGADMDWLGIRIANPGGAVTIQGPGTLTLGASGIDMASASADFTSQNALALAADQTWNVGSGRTLTLAGSLSISKNKKLTLAGAGIVNAGILNGTEGRATISGGTLTVSNQLGVLGSGSVILTNQGWLNLYGRATVGSGYGTGLGVLNLSGGNLNICSASASLAVAARGQINANGGSITNGSSGSITVTVPITLESGGLILPAISGGTRNVTLSGRLTGPGGLTTALGGSCNTYLTGNNGFAGPLIIKLGYFHNSGTYAIPAGCGLTNNAQWAVDKSVTLGSFAGTGGIFRDGGQGPATITAGYNNADGAYAGSIGEGSGSPLSLTKIGSGILTLSGTCSYTGNTTVSNGTLLVDGALKSSVVDVKGGGLGGRGIISSNVNLAVGAKAVFSDTATLTIAGTLKGAGNLIHLTLSSNVSAGYYLLATCGSGAIGAFSQTPIVYSGSFAAGTTNYFISTPNDTQIWLVVQNQNPNPPTIAGRLTWPAKQFLPTFPASAPIIDCIDVTGAAGPVSDLFASLQGIVNRSQPRIACVGNPEEGKFTWMANHEVTYRMNSGFNLIYQHRGLLSGLVVPDPNMPDTLNLATTIAGLTNALICDPGFLSLLTNAPYNLPVVMDLRGRFADKYQVYGHLRSNYWDQCTHRIITSLDPGVHGCLRDYIVAIKAACVWLNPGSVTADATALAPFMTSMKPVASLWMGWVPNENDDVAWLGQYGIPVLASDYYQNGSLYSGLHSSIDVPAVPTTPQLQNKIYVCFMLSDGDNIAYMQHKMRGVWNDSARGQVPIGWTVSSLACDIDPGMLNYYWRSATPNDCLISGPSGAGYAKIEHWSPANAIAYTEASAPYLLRGGQSVITVWDSLSTAKGLYYGTNCPALAGLIDHGGGYYTTTSKGRVPVMGMPSGANYASTPADLIAGITNTAAGWAGNAPMFIPVQGSGWDITPSELVTVANALDSRFIVVRPDTMFLLYRKFMGQGVVIDPPPTNLRAVRRFNGQVILTWSGSADATGYVITRSLVSGMGTPLATAVNSSFVDTESEASQTYYYRIATKNLAGVSSFSTQLAVPPFIEPAGSYAAAVMDRNPMAYWPLNETSGSVAYDLAGGYDGAFTSGVVLGQPGIPNGGFGFPGNFAPLFNGTSSRIEIPGEAFNLTNALTITAWVKVPTVLSHFSGIAGRGDASWRLSVNTSGKPGGNNAHASGDATSPTSIVNTNWHMVAYTYSGVPNVSNNGRLYVDGALVAMNTVGVLSGTDSDVWIGGSPDYGTARLLSGSVAHVAIFTNALSPAHISALFALGSDATPRISLNPMAFGETTLVWSGGTLLQATNVAGPWMINSSQSPCLVLTTNAQMFFKLE